MHPKTKLGRSTLWFGYLALGLNVLRAIFRAPSGTMLSGWATFLSFVFLACAVALGFRYLRQKLMWRLRNRLIVTYVFIGVIPVILLLVMGLLASYLFAGQFATYVAMSDLQSGLQHLEATNRSLATQFRTLAKIGKLNEQLAGEIASASDENFRHRTVSVWDGEGGFSLAEAGRVPAQPIKASTALKGDFAGMVLDGNRLHLRVMKRVEEGPHRMVVISDVPVTSELLRQATSELGLIKVLPPEEDAEDGTPASAASTAADGKPEDNGQTATAPRRKVHFTTSAKSSKQIEAGSVPPATNSFDVEFPFGTRFNVIDWRTGMSADGLLLVDTRPSMLYATLFSTLGENAGIFRDGLILIAIIFGIIELIALFVGMRLSRSMTKSVAELYTATQHVNRGELEHRIRIRTHDQMAALEGSFNSMTQSLANLIAEQKEKQRLEGELAIAHEVQTLLYPADMNGLNTLEIHGVCQPARTVSGDYYDFIPLSDERLVVAVGDISGKGISAALLMATVHAFVRAYSLEPEQTLAAVAAGGSAPTHGLAVSGRSNCNSSGELAPGLLMETLNYQLFRSTPASKYATMFLGSYDARSRTLRYSNAGHLPPLVVSADGEVRRMDTSGTVVGLFDAMTYEESTIAMKPGDVFVAYSDGITEPENEFGEFGEERLIELIKQHHDQPLPRICDVVTSAVADWIAGGEQPDDVTLVLARAR